MSIARVGSIIEVDTTNLGGVSGSTSVTIPTGVDLLVIALSGYIATASSFSTHPPTLGGTALTAIAAADANTSDYNGCLYYMVSPAAGTKTLAWNWVNAPPGSANNPIMALSFYSGTDLTAPIRDSDGKQTGTGSLTSKTLTIVSGDKLVAWASAFEAAGVTNTFTWTNATAVQGVPTGTGANSSTATASNNSTLDLAEASPAANGTVSVSWSKAQDGALMAIVLKPAASSAQTLAVGHISSGASVRGVALAPGSATLAVGHISSGAAVRGVTLGAAGAASLSVGKVASGATVRGVLLTGHGASALGVGKVASSSAVRGASLTPGATTLLVGKVGSSSTVRGVTLVASGPATLSVGHITSGASVRGVTMSTAVLTLAVGKITAATGGRAGALRYDVTTFGIYT